MDYEISNQFTYLIKYYFIFKNDSPRPLNMVKVYVIVDVYWVCNIVELVQERRNPGALAMELRLSCVNPSTSNLDYGNLPCTYVLFYASFTDKDYVNHN